MNSNSVKLKQLKYDKVFSDPKSYPYKHFQYIIDTLKEYDFNSLLEVGCGKGRKLRLIRNNFDVKVLKGIDISPVGVDVALKHKLDVVVGSADNLPFSDNYFDIVITHHSLEQMKYIIDDVIKELYRVTKKYVISFEPCFELQNIFGKFHNFTHDYVKGLPYIYEKYGFEIQKFVNLKVGILTNRTCLLVCKKIKK